MGKILKTTIKSGLINYIGVIIGFISLLFIQTKVLTESEIGVIRLILDKALLVMPFFLFGIHSVASRFYFYFENSKKEYNSFITFLFVAPLSLFVIGAIIYNLTNFSIEIPNIFHIFLVLFFLIYIQIFESYLSIKQKVVFPYFLRYIVFRLLYIVLIFLYYFNIITFDILKYFYVAIYLIHFLILITYFFKHLKYSFKIDFSFFNSPVFKEIITYCSFLILGAGSGVLVSKLDTIMLEGITNNQGFVGVYTIAFAMASVIEVPRRPILKLSIPLLSKNLKENKMLEVLKLYKQSAINLVIIGTVLFSLIWLNIDLIFNFIPNSDIYLKGKYVVFFLGLAKLFDLAVGVNNEILQSSKYYKWNIILMPLLAVVAISSNYYFISRFNIVGAAVATAISILLLNIARSFLVYYKMKLNPFDINYLKTISFLLLPFLLNYFFKTENIYINFVLNLLYVLLLVLLPLYKLKLSKEFNIVVDLLLKKLNFISK